MYFKDYTPQDLSEIVFADEGDKKFITNIVDGRYPFPASGKNGILLYGVNGTGKSALAKLLPDAIEKVKSGTTACATFDRIEEGNNGAKVIARLRKQAEFVPWASHHYFILDEVDNLKGPSMSSLKSLMNISETIFIMTTNRFTEIENGVIDRCHCIPFNAATSVKWLPLANRILIDNGINKVSDESIIRVIDTCRGSARNIVDCITRIVVELQTSTGLQTYDAAGDAVHDSSSARKL